MPYSIAELKEMVKFCKAEGVQKFQLGQTYFEFQPTAFISDEVKKAVDVFDKKKTAEVDELGLTAEEQADLTWSSESPL